MPRVTRAQLRAQIIHDDFEAIPTTATQGYNPFSIEVSSRPPLGEIQNNNTSLPQSDLTEQLTLAKVSQGLTTANNCKKKDIDLIHADQENSLASTDQEVLEDDRRSEASSAAEVVAEELKRDESVGEPFQVPIDTSRPRTPPSTAAREASRSLSRSPEIRLNAVQGSAMKTPRFDPVVHAEMPSACDTAEHGVDDSFVRSIKKRTPARMATSMEPGDGPDSFLEDIISRSPSKYVARIEDSVEAVDALEEAIEQVAEELPKAIPQSLDSPVKVRKQRTTTGKANSKQSVSGSGPPARQAAKRGPAARPTSTTKTSTQDKAVPHKSAPRVSSARPQARSSTLTTIEQAPSPQCTALAASAKPAQPAPSTTTANKRTTNTILSTLKPGFIPLKSTKQPTKSNFTLPGDAISTKMKARREERLKKENEAEAEAARKRSEFKARPVPKAMNAAVAGNRRVSSVLPRETTTSRARMSLMAAKKDADAKEGIAPAAKKVVAGSGLDSVKAGSGARRSVLPSTTQSGLSVTKTRRASPAATAAVEPPSRANKSTIPANSSAVRRNTATVFPAPAKTRHASIQITSPLGNPRGSERSSSTNPATGTATATVTTKGTGTSKGKEVFSRGKVAEEDLQKQKRQREDAAKKARAEAAERGRLASREWAEKQRKRKTMETVQLEGLEGGDVNGIGREEIVCDRVSREEEIVG